MDDQIEPIPVAQYAVECDMLDTIEILDPPKARTSERMSDSKAKYQVMSTMHSSGIRRAATATRVMLSQHSPGQRVRRSWGPLCERSGFGSKPMWYRSLKQAVVC